jgi:hypothetical protein
VCDAIIPEWLPDSGPLHGRRKAYRFVFDEIRKIADNVISSTAKFRDDDRSRL